MTADAAHVIALLFGLLCIVVFFRSIIIAVFLDRPRHDVVARWAARATRMAFALILSGRPSQARTDRVLLWYWPVAQFVTVYAWYALVIIGFGAVNWGVAASPDMVGALIASGSAVSTLGFATPPNARGQVIAFIEGGIGLLAVVFLLTFLPGYLSARQRRADRVAAIYARAGSPPTGAALVAWHYRSGQSGDLDQLLTAWEGWIRELGVSHSQSPGLAITRSYYPSEYWLSAVMAMLDAAALAKDVIEGSSATADVFIGAAQRALEHVADAIRAVPMPPPPASRAAFDAACEAMRAAGAPVRGDRDAAWHAFHATQDGYAARVVGLTHPIRIGPGTWQLTGRE